MKKQVLIVIVWIVSIFAAFRLGEQIATKRFVALSSQPLYHVRYEYSSDGKKWYYLDFPTAPNVACPPNSICRVVKY